MNRLTTIFSTVAILACASHLHADIPYYNDFENPNDPLIEWSDPAAENSVPVFTRFVGRHASELLTITLPSTPGATYTLLFDLYIIDSWDGARPGYNFSGPDYFNVAVDGDLLLHETFLNFDWENYGQYQSYPSPSIPRQDWGYSGSDDAIYRDVTLQATASGSSIVIGFQGEGLQGYPDETWGVDNVRVFPEPGCGILLAIAGSIIFGTKRLDRR